MTNHAITNAVRITLHGIRLTALSGTKIVAIKDYRDAFGEGLKASKDAVEALMAMSDIPAMPYQLITTFLVRETVDDELIPISEWILNLAPSYIAKFTGRSASLPYSVLHKEDEVGRFPTLQKALDYAEFLNKNG